MRMNTNIPMMGQPVNVLAAFGQGQQAGAQTNEIRHTNALRNMLAEQGPGIRAGDPNALDNLSRLDLPAALGVEGHRQTMAHNEEKMRLAYESARQNAAEVAMQMTAAERADQQQRLERGLAALTTAQTPEQWDAIVQDLGQPELLGQFGQRDILQAQAMGLKWALENSQGANDTAKEQQIARLMETGLSREIAIGIADGRYAVSDGRVLDRATGQILGEVPLAFSEPPAEASGQGGLYSRADDATGVIPSIGRAASATLGQLPGVGGLFQAPDMVAAGQAYQQAQNDLVRALSINPRFPVAEMQMIRDELGIRPGAFRSPADTRVKMRELDSYLRRRADVERAAANDPTLPRSERDNAARAVRDIENFVSLLGVPQDGASQAPAQAGQEPVPAGARQNVQLQRAAEQYGLTIEELWQNLSPEARERLSR
jgi:hypothetical protein